MRTVSETSRTALNYSILIIVVPEEEDKRKGHEEIFEGATV